MAASPAINGGGVTRLTIYSEGTQLDETIGIISVTVSKSVNKIPVAKIIAADGNMPEKDFPVSNAECFKPGCIIKINAGYGDEEDTLFEGVVIKHGIMILGGNEAKLVIECRDKAVGMTVGRKNANYVNNKDSDIISKLIAQYSELSSDVSTTTTEYKELVQYYCTDWDFLLSRAEVNGLLVCVDDGKVSVKPPDIDTSPELNITYGEDLIEFHAEIDARTQLTEVNATSWDLKNQAVIEEQISAQSLNDQGDLTSSDLAKVINLDSFRLQSSAPMEKTALKEWGDGQQLKAGLARIQGRMKFQGSAKAKIGTLIELEGVGNRFKGQVFVSTVTHDISNGNWTTEVDFGMSPNWFSEKRDLVAPPASGLIPGVEGLQIGVVMKLDEDPEGQHKIQVSVPVLQAETEGVWARLAHYYASDGIGIFFVPEIGDEVILGYFNNDPSNPVVLGSLYSSKRNPPYSLTADNFIKAIVTKSELKIEFDDDNKKVTIITPGDNKVVLSDEEKSIVVQDQNSNKVELSEDGIVLDSPKDISITAKGKITIEAVGEIGVSSKSDVNVEGLNINNSANVGFVAQGSASAELSASGQTTVKGALVMIN